MSSKLLGSKDSEFTALQKRAMLAVHQAKARFTADTTDKKAFEAFINLTDDTILEENELAYALYPMGFQSADLSPKK